MTISDFCRHRFLRYHGVSPSTRQEYGYVVKNHVVPYIGHLRISEVNRETFFNLLVQVLPAEEASQVTIRATRKVLSAMRQMAFGEGYRGNNPIRSIRIRQAPAKPILVASHDQWRRLEEALTYPPAKLYARLDVTTWARRCEMIGFRPRDFELVSTTGIVHEHGTKGARYTMNCHCGKCNAYAREYQRDTSLADALEEIFDHSRPAVGGHQDAEELDDAVDYLAVGRE